MLALSFGAVMMLTAAVGAHMQLHNPAPFNASNNPHRRTPADEYLEYPYDCCGEDDRWTYPCRGYMDLLETPQGAPTATWKAGSAQNFSLSGPAPLGGNHYGGSCQVGFSSDRGQTFRVAKSFEGNCPHRHGGVSPDGQTFDFDVPHDLHAGVHVFAWIWYNREQEFNMNCAAVNITTSAFPSGTPSTIALASQPLMLVADVGNGCSTPKTTAEVRFPDPGLIVETGDGWYPLELPDGECGQNAMALSSHTQAYHGYTGNDGH